MLLILMYHQIIDPKNDIEVSINKFKQHLIYLQQNFNIVLPGDCLAKNKISVCLTFDDAYADFYIHIFPLLKLLNIPAILAIPANFIEDFTNVNNVDRLSVKYPLGLEKTETKKSPLCTWEEIRSMVASGLVCPASHSFSHANLAKINFSEVFKEICTSKRIIWIKLEKIAETMVYPFGAQNKQVHNMAKNHYKYLMRIGNACNYSWDQNILYRVSGDNLWKNHKYISIFQIFFWKTKYIINRLRGK